MRQAVRAPDEPTSTSAAGPFESASILRDVRVENREQRLVERLVAAGEALSAERLDRSRIGQIVLREAVEAFRAPLAGVFLVEAGRLRTLAHHGARRELLLSMERMALETPGWAAGDAVRRGVPLFLATEAEIEDAYPDVGALPVRSGYRGGLAFVPLRAGGDVLGLLGLRFDHDRILNDAERGFLQGFAHQAALALERVSAFEAEQSARREAEAAAWRERVATARAEFLAHATELLARSLDDTGLREVATLATPSIADVCTVHVLTGEGALRLVAASPDAADVDPTVLERLAGPGAGPCLVTDAAEGAGLLDVLRAHSAIVTPLAIHDRAFGWIVLADRDPTRRFHVEDVGVAAELARRAAGAVENSRLYADLARARERAEFLSTASERLSHGLTDDALRQVASLAVPLIADWCFVNLLTPDGRRENVAAAHVDPDRRALAEAALRERRATDPIRVPHTVFVDELTDDILQDFADDSEHLEQLRAFDARSYLSVPIRGGGAILGSLAFLTERASARRLREADIELAEELARRIAPAIETARLHDDLRRLATREMARAQEVEAVLHAVGEPIVVADRDGRVRIANSAAIDAFGGTVPPNLEAIRSRFEELRSAPAWRPGEATGPVEARLRDTGRWYELTAYPVARGNDESPAMQRVATAWPGPGHTVADDPPGTSPASTILVVRDVTERRRVEDLREAFIGVLSHELRTPITTIFGGTKVLMRDGLSEETRREVAADVVAESERLHRLVEDLLVLARAERGALDLGGDPVLVQHVIARVIRSEAPRWPAVHLRTRLPSSVPAVNADETYVEQIVRNLVGNAAKYAGPGAQVEIVVEEDADEVIVRVLDDGPGFADEEAMRLFDLFYRANGSAAKSGAGIGLFVCKALVEAMHGRIWAMPQPGGGAEFGIALPVFGDEG